MPDPIYITPDGRKFEVKDTAVFLKDFPDAKPYRDPFWQKASEGYNEAARKDAEMSAMSPKDRAAQIVGEFQTIKMPEVKERNVLGSPLRIDMSEYTNVQNMKKDVQAKAEEFRHNILRVKPEDRADVIASIETNVKDPLLKPELLRIAKSKDYISPVDLALGRQDESTVQSDILESAGQAAEKLGRQGVWNIPKFVVDTRRGRKITKENVDNISEGLANSFLGYDIPDKDKKEVMREMLGYNQNLSGILGQGLVDMPAFMIEMAAIGLFTGGAGSVPKLSVEGASKVARTRKIYNGLVKIAESGLESGGKFAGAEALAKGQTDPGEVGHNMLAGLSFHTGEAATQAVTAHTVGKWLMNKQGASARIANNMIKLIGSAASGSVVSAGLSGDLSMENIAREAPINVMMAFMTHGNPAGKKKYKEFAIQNGIKEGIIKPEDAPVYEHYLDKWLDQKSINEIFAETKDVLTKVDAAVVAGSKVRMNYEWPLEEVDKAINEPVKETKDGKEKEVQKEEMLKFSHWGDVPGGMTDPTKIGTGVPGADQAKAKAADLSYTSAVVKGSPYKEKRVQSKKEYDGELPKSRVYDFDAEKAQDDPFYQEALKKTGGDHSEAILQMQKDIVETGNYDAIRFINERDDYQLRIYKPVKVSEVNKEQNDALALKNESVKANAERIGVSFDEDVVKVSNKELVDGAMAELSKDPLAATKVREKYLNEPGTPNPQESALLLLDWVEKNNNLDALAAEYNRSGDPDALQKMQNEMVSVGQIGQMLHDVGTQQGRAFNFRKTMMKRDYSLAKILSDKTISKGAPLNNLEIEQAKQEAATLKSKSDAVILQEEKAKEKEVSGRTQELLSDLKSENEKNAKAANREVKLKEIRTRRQDILGRLAKNQKMQAGGLADIKEFGELVANHIEELAYKGAWKVEDLIDRVKKDLKGVGLSATDDEIRKFYEDSKRITPGKEGFKHSDVRKLAKTIVGEGVKDVNDLIDRVHEALKLEQPDITRREAMELMVNYGKTRMLPKEQIELDTRDLLAQDRELLKIEDLGKGILPPAAYESMKPSDALRTLKAQVNQLKKTIPLSAAQSDAKIKSSLQTMIRRMENAINDLKEEIAAGQRKVKGKGTPIPLNERATRLKEELKALREEADKLFANDAALARRKAYVKGQISKYKSLIEKGDYEKKKYKTKNYNTDSDLAKAEFELAKERAKYEEGLFGYELAKRTKAQKAWDGATNIIDLGRAIKTGIDVSAPLRQGALLYASHPVISTRAIKDMMEAFFSEQKSRAINRSIIDKEYYPLASKAKLYLAEHGHSLSQREEMARSKWADHIPLIGASQRAYSTYLNVVRYGAFESLIKSMESTGRRVTVEEAKAMANLINVVSGRGKGSIGSVNLEGALDTANRVFFAPRFVLSRFQTLAGQPLFQEGAGLNRQTAMIAKEYLKYIVGASSMLALGNLYMDSQGDEMETDPRSSKAGKIKIGDTYLDILASLQQTAVFASRVLSGETIDKYGDVQALRGEDRGQRTVGDVAGSFARSKLAPWASVATDFATGTVFNGQPLDEYVKEIEVPGIGNIYETALEQGMSEDEALNWAKGVHVINSIATPMNIAQIWESAQEEGMPLGAFLGILSTFGISMNTYKEDK